MLCNAMLFCHAFKCYAFSLVARRDPSQRALRPRGGGGQEKEADKHPSTKHRPTTTATASASALAQSLHGAAHLCPKQRGDNLRGRNGLQRQVAHPCRLGSIDAIDSQLTAVLQGQEFRVNRRAR
jgi:hypothetical protein